MERSSATIASAACARREGGAEAVPEQAEGEGDHDKGADEPIGQVDERRGRQLAEAGLQARDLFAELAAALIGGLAALPRLHQRLFALAQLAPEIGALVLRAHEIGELPDERAIGDGQQAGAFLRALPFRGVLLVGLGKLGVLLVEARQLGMELADFALLGDQNLAHLGGGDIFGGVQAIAALLHALGHELRVAIVLGSGAGRPDFPALAFGHGGLERRDFAGVAKGGQAAAGALLAAAAPGGLGRLRLRLGLGRAVARLQPELPGASAKGDGLLRA